MTKRLFILGKIKNFCLVLLMVTVGQGLTAQVKEIKGVVRSGGAVNEPLIGVNIVNKADQTGTITDVNGNFTIKASKGNVILFSYLGYEEKENVVGDGNTMNVFLTSTSQKIEEVVITAFGITKEKRGLTHAAASIKGDDIAETVRENFLNSLTGKVAGLTTNISSGAPGASTQIVLRGINSLSGNNSPLFIVDGLPVQNSVVDQNNLVSQGSNRGDDFTNRIADLNPNDIESVTILKGPEAAALYGIDAGSGAIVITTKKGKQGSLRINYDNNFRIDQTIRFPKVQTLFGLGIQGSADSRTMSAFGPRIPEGIQVYDNVKGFFQDALTMRHNLNFEGGKQGISYRISLSSVNQEGTVPTTGYNRYNGRGTVSYISPNKKLDISGTAAYTKSTNFKTLRGAGGFLQALLYWPVTDDAKNYIKDDGTRRRYFDDTGFAELDNPYWQVNNDKSQDKTDRFNYNLSGTYKVSDWLSVTARGSIDQYNTLGFTFNHPESNTYYTQGGQIEKYTEKYLGFSGVTYASFQKNIGKIENTLRIGAAVDDFETKFFSERGQKLRTPTEKFDPTFATLDQTFARIDSATYANSRTVGRDTLRIRRLVGQFFEYSFNYDRWLYFNVAGRRDLTSTLPEQSRSFFYPSAGISIVFSELLAPDSKTFDFGKIRFSYAETAKDIQPYGSQSVYVIQTSSGGGVGLGFTNNNKDIKPERQKTFEIGTELNFFNNRLGFDYSYYNTNNIGQIVRLVRLSYGTGFILSTLNVADTRNRGMELVITGKPIWGKDFGWEVNLNGAGTRNVVKNLPSNIPEYYNSDSWVSAFRNGIVPGGTTTTITGNDYQRNNNGQILIDPSSGVPLLSNPAYIKIGDRNPDLLGGFLNTFRYKKLSLTINTDFRIGGDIVNGTEYAMVLRGVSTRTLDREKLIIVPGVLNDGLQNTANPTINTITVDPYFSNYYSDGRLYASNFVEKDIKWLRIREVILRYNFPPSKYFKNLSAFISGTDLAIFTNYSGADPGVNANNGATSGVGSFGMDFFGASTPRGFSVGLKASIGK
jgi:TonB-linked SusC/RagA family outer membrane protein